MKINSLDNMGIIPRPTYAVIDMKRFGSNIDIARNLSKCSSKSRCLWTRGKSFGKICL